MSTTSSSRADRSRIGLALTLFAGLVALPAAAEPPRVAPEAPRAAPVAPAGKAAAAGEGLSRRPVELRTVAVRRAGADEAAEKMGPAFAAAARDPLAIEITTVEPLGDLARTASPVIVLNGAVLSGTVPQHPDQLIAYLPDPGRIREVNVVEVVWLGDETRTRSPRPLSFRATDLR